MSAQAMQYDRVVIRKPRDGRKKPITRTVRLWLTSADLHTFLLRREHNGKLIDGYSDREEGSIYIDAAMPDREYPETFLHELAHAIYYEPNRPNGFWEFEEQAVTRLIPALTRILLAQGWTPPPLPEDRKAIVNRARRVRRHERSKG